MTFTQKFVTVIIGTLLLGKAVLSIADNNQDSYMEGILSSGGTFSYIWYFGEESGDSIVWYFDTSSAAGKKILSVCKAKSNCIVEGTTQIESKVPEEIPEATSGASKIISVTGVSTN